MIVSDIHEKDIIELIDEKYVRMSKSHKKIAQFIKEHYDQAVFMTAAKIGTILDISESTVVRFASGLGFDGFPDFQNVLADWVKNKINTVSKMGAKYGQSTQSEILVDVLQADIEKIGDTINQVDPDAFEAAVDSIIKAKTVYVVGLRTCEPLADFLSFYLNMIRGNVVVLRTTSASEMFEQMIRIDEKDVLIGISFPRYSTATAAGVQYCRSVGATVIGLTNSLMSPIGQNSDYVLVAKSDMVSLVDSLVAPLSVVNALIVALASAREEKLAASFDTLERVWETYNVYEKRVDNP
mgnify:CR=1 FL=1